MRLPIEQSSSNEAKQGWACTHGRPAKVQGGISTQDFGIFLY